MRREGSGTGRRPGGVWLCAREGGCRNLQAHALWPVASSAPCYALVASGMVGGVGRVCRVGFFSDRERALNCRV